MRTLAIIACFFVFACIPAGAEIAVTNMRGGFQHFFQQVTQHKKAHVAFIGGSITQTEKGHSGMIPVWLKEKFPDCEFTFTNAGLSSTCSTSGAFRVARHVLSKGPVDLFIVEYAVNDDQDGRHASRECLRGMEGVIRRIRAANAFTDILMVHYVNADMLKKVQKGETPISIEAHEKVAVHYGITTVNVAAALANGVMSWKEYGGTHPKHPGSRLAVDLMVNAIESAWSDNDKKVPHNLPAAQLDPYSYTQGKFVDVKKASFRKGWKIGKVSSDLLPVGSIRDQYLEYDVLRADEPGTTLTFSFTGKTVGAFILAGPDAGMVETSVDGDEWITHDLFHHYSSKLNYPRSVIFATDLKEGPHQLSLRISKEQNQKSKGTSASILFFEVDG